MDKKYIAIGALVAFAIWWKRRGQHRRSRDVICYTPRGVETALEISEVTAKVNHGYEYFEAHAKHGKVICRGDLAIHYAVLECSNPLGVVVFMTGWSESLLKYGDFYEELNGLGYNVVVLDHRSQGLSQRSQRSFKEQFDHLKTHVEDFHDHLSDALLVLQNVVAPMKMKNTFIIGFSLGGLVATHVATLFNPTGLILVAPCLEPKTGFPSLLLQMVTSSLRWMGRGENFVPGHPTGQDHRMLLPPNSRVSSSSARIKFWERIREQRSEVCINGMSVAHLDELLRARVGPSLTKRIIAKRVLVFSAELDAFVQNSAIETFVENLPFNVDCRYVHVRSAKHELLQERNEIRARIVDEIKGFLASASST